MNIGFDLDKIFINYPPFMPDWLIDKLYKEKDNGILKYRIPGKAEQLIRKASHHPILRPLIKENVDFLGQLAKDKNNNLFLISSRFEFLKRRTDKLSKKYHFDEIFKKLYFNYNNIQPHIFKDEAIKEAKIDRYVDDDLSLLKYVAGTNPETLFFWLHPANHTQKQLDKNLFAITHINQLLESV